ncbi:MAG TPA: IS66 family transposase [Chloroflexia bacterium]|nr:IS66 family transposase [Chloroflexia bacterium]
MSEEEAIALLTENASLRATIASLVAELRAANELTAQLQARILELEQGPPTPPSFVKPNKPAPPADRPPRRKRAPQHNNARRLQLPTQVRQVALANCPDCSYRLYGASIARKRQLLDLPPPQPVEVIEYQLIKRYCPACAKWHEPKLSLPGLLVGQSRFSGRIMALVAWLRTSLRLPLRQIQQYLAQMHQLSISVGEISAMLARVAEQGAGAAAALKECIRQSKVIYMDETGWRESGQNGYVWVMSNGAGERYFEYHHSRAGAVARSMSGTHYKGTLCSDFYAAYNEHACRHQRCWAHLLRDLAALEEQVGPSNAEIVEWIKEVVGLYKLGQELDGRSPPPSQQQREVLAVQLRARAHELGLKWATETGHAAQALCKRLLRHEGELFEFVRQAEVGATNNEAERAIRPLAVARKISGGSRSAEGSKTRMRLQSLFSSWHGRGLNPLEECLRMFGMQTPLPQV